MLSLDTAVICTVKSAVAPVPRFDLSTVTVPVAYPVPPELTVTLVTTPLTSITTFKVKPLPEPPSAGTLLWLPF